MFIIEKLVFIQHLTHRALGTYNLTVCKKKNGRPVIYKFASLYIMGAIFSSHTVFITKLFSMSL